MYIEKALTNYKGLWLYLVGFLVVFLASQTVGAVPLVLAMALYSIENGSLPAGDMMEKIYGLYDSNIMLPLILFSFIVGAVALYFWVKGVHKQTFVSLITSRDKVDWKRIRFAFLLWAVFIIVPIAVDYQMNPESYQWNFNLVPFLILLTIGVFLIPIQTSYEEFLFRGYLMQGVGVAAKNRWMPLVVTSVLFGLMHLANPEVTKLGYGIMGFYIGTGFFLGVLTLMDDGLELAMGFHAANNLVSALLVTAKWTAFQTHSVLIDISEPSLGADMLVPILVFYPLLLFIMAKKYKWTNWKDRLFGPVKTIKQETVMPGE